MENNDTKSIIGLIADSTKEIRHTVDKRLATGINEFFNFVKLCTPIKLMYLKVEEARYIFEQDQRYLKEKYEQISEENRIEPNPRIVLNAANEYSYCLKEEEIRKMFLNLIASDINKDKKDSVHPSFINIVKSLSTEDAKFLKKLNSAHMNAFPVDFVQSKVPISNSSITLKKVLILHTKETLILNDFILENLERLNLIKIFDNQSLTGCTLYGKGFEYVKSNDLNRFKGTLNYKKGCLEITNLGKRFINVCLN